MRELEEHIRQIEAQMAREEAQPDEPQDDSAACTPPFFLDSSGLKHLRSECKPVTQEASCSVLPFVVGSDGLKRLRAACIY